MPRFSANISMLFAERDWLDRPAAAAAAGFGAVEIQFPYDRPAADWQRAIDGASQRAALHSANAHDADAVCLGMPDQVPRPRRPREILEFAG